MRSRTILGILVALLGVSLPALAVSNGKRPLGRSVMRGETVKLFAQGLTVAPGVRHEHLTIFPVTATEAVVPAVRLTLDQAGARGLIQVSELKESEVNRLRITNRAKEPVFVMAGEMVRGGKQDRIMADDLVIPAKTTLTVAVFCVEHGRWSAPAGSEGFSTGHSLAGKAARAAGAAGEQGQVWAEVAEQQRALKAPSTTGALRSVHDSAVVKSQIAPYQKAFGNLPSRYPRASGIVAVANGEILAADLFSSPELFRQCWPELLEAYAIDALQQAAEPVRREQQPPFTVREIGNWLAGLRTAQVHAKPTPGEGIAFDVRGASLRGAGLISPEGGVVHVGLFPAAPKREEPQPNTLQFRRDHLPRE